MAKLQPIPFGKSMPTDEEGNIHPTHEENFALPLDVEEEEVEESGEEEGEEEQ